MKNKKLSIKEVQVGNRTIFFSFQERPYYVSLDRKTGFLTCTCINGSNFGVNNKQVCYHKQYILDNLKNIIKKNE